MSLQLLATKFNLPLAGAKVVRRQRLLRLLDEGLEQNAALIIVCGPAGYGKTTIVSEWIAALTPSPLPPGEGAGIRVAWLTLERGDDDLTRFLAYFVTALQRIRPGFGEGILKTLRTHKPQPIPTLATWVINELSEAPERVILVLDDFHLLTAESIQSFIAFLVDHQPPQLCLVIVTRVDPPLPLARLRARGRLVELRQRELCFSPEEVGEFANRMMGLALSPEQVRFLAEQTEGWISGLQLAALSMRSQPDRSVFFSAFSGEHEFIADYLTDEVLSYLSESLRAFLLQTSILERLSAPLCEAVTAQAGAQATLAQLVDANLFVVPLDDRQTWYRYHTLFADLLRKRLQDVASAQVGELHIRASRWYEENSQIDLSIDHAIAGKDFERAVRLIEGVAEGLLMHGQATTLLRWLEALPETETLARPLLGSLYGITLIMCGRPSPVVAGLLEKMQASGILSEFQGETNMLQALLATFQGDATRTIQLAEKALQQLSAQRPFFRSLAADSLGMGYTLAGDIPAAARAFEQVVEISRQSDNVMMTLMALTNLSGLHYVQGELRLAIRTCQQVLDLASQRIGRQAPILGKTLFNLGEMLREQGDLDAGLKYLLEAAGMMESFSEVGLPVVYLAIARIKMNEKDWPAAQSTIDRARQQTQGSQSAIMNERLVDVIQVRYWIARGELEPALQWAGKRGFLERSPSEIFAEAGRNAAINELFQAEYLTLIRLTLAQQQPEPALEQIAVLQEFVEKKKYQRRTIDILILKALALQQKGDLEQALLAIGKALAMAESDGYQRIFVDEGEPMARLLYQAVTRGISPVYAGRLLEVFAQERSANRPFQSSSSLDLIEPMSERELEVLQLIAEGLSNREIAGRLYISLSTVKGHTTNIFGKLGVKNRNQAVARARSLGILAPL